MSFWGFYLTSLYQHMVDFIAAKSPELAIAKWHEYINDPTLADAFLNRLTANAHRVELKGESLRRKKVKTNQ